MSNSPSAVPTSDFRETKAAITGGGSDSAGERSGAGKGNSFASVSAQQFSELFQGDDPIKVVDVRTPAEFREAHLDGVELVPLDRFDGAKIAAACVDETVYMMCGSGKRASMAASKLCAAGHQKVVVVAGGMAACDEVGMEVQRGKKAMSLERQVRIAAGFLVLAGAVLSILNPWWISLSGFVGAGLMFAGITDTCAMGMLMAKMPWNR